MPSSERLRRPLRWLVPVFLVAAGGAAYAGMMMRPPPADLDLTLTRATVGGLYRATAAPESSPVSVGPMHAWTITVETAAGDPVDGAILGIDGGMPQHGHGLPTAPQVTQALGDGRYLVEGMRFNMPGWWTITVTVDGPAGEDAATFNLLL